MKKFLVLAMVATLLMAGSAFAGKHIALAPNSTFAFGVGGAASGPSTTNNDDSCDIGTFPAATLLLPYFEVDFNSPQTTAQTTLFTVTNTSDLPAIAKVTLWTDWSFPVLDFNIFLTGYDVQAINLYDIIQRGIIAPNNGTTSNGSATGPSPIGSLSAANNANPNIAGIAVTGPTATCLGLPGGIPPTILADIRTGLTTGLVSSCGTNRVGGTHANAIGYATIDVVNNCTSTLPSSGTYYTNEILFDNWLIGDYQQINPNPATGNYAGGNPLVHIRAIPEGGPAGSVPSGVTNLPRTFYARYVQNTGTNALNPQFRDRRQPLPATFAARYIQGGTGAFNTNFKIWREGRELVAAPAGYGPAATTATASCTSVLVNATIPISEIVRFDEHENPTTFANGVIISPSVPTFITLPETSATPTSSSTFPLISTSGDVGGWMYLNLDSQIVAGSSTAGPGPAPGGINVLHPAFGPAVSQNWVVVSFFAEGRYSVDFDAATLGNGCNPHIATSTANGGTVFLGPAGQTPVCPASTTPIGCTPGVAPYIGTNTTP